MSRPQQPTTDTDINDDTQKEEVDRDSILSNAIVGIWRYFDGDINVGLTSGGVDKTIEFTSSGNYREEVITYNYNAKDNLKSTNVYGNWNINSEELSLKDWNGNEKAPFVIEAISADELVIIDYNNAKTISLRRDGSELNDISSLILGQWYYYITNKQSLDKFSPSYNFNSDGIVVHRGCTFDLPTRSEYEWKLEGKTLSMTTLPVRYHTDTYKIRCCNRQYLIFDSTVLKRTKWN